MSIPGNFVGREKERPAVNPADFIGDEENPEENAEEKSDTQDESQPQLKRSHKCRARKEKGTPIPYSNAPLVPPVKRRRVKRELLALSPAPVVSPLPVPPSDECVEDPVLVVQNYITYLIF